MEKRASTRLQAKRLSPGCLYLFKIPHSSDWQDFGYIEPGGIKASILCLGFIMGNSCSLGALQGTETPANFTMLSPFRNLSVPTYGPYMADMHGGDLVLSPTLVLILIAQTPASSLGSFGGGERETFIGAIGSFHWGASRSYRVRYPELELCWDKMDTFLSSPVLGNLVPPPTFCSLRVAETRIPTTLLFWRWSLVFDDQPWYTYDYVAHPPRGLSYFWIQFICSLIILCSFCIQNSWSTFPCLGMLRKTISWVLFI